MSSILFLTHRMLRGYGVDVAVHNLALEVKKRGHRITVLCEASDGSFDGYPIEVLPATMDNVEACARVLKAHVLVAHTSPFYEMLPALRARYRVFACEYGDPPPELFPDAAGRSAVKQFKVASVYPLLDGVAAISRFIASDCDWPKAKIIYCGCDHMPDLGPKIRPCPEAAQTPAILRLGTLMRLGRGEALYKGNQSYRDLCHRLRQRGVQIECHVMGRGNPSNAQEFEREGIRVHLNATDAEREKYLRELDIFVSLSTWEGFNLPLVEAEALGTLGIALNVGAHAEVTPFAFDNLETIQDFIERCATDRRALFEQAGEGYRYVRARFNWSDAAEEWLAWMGLSREATDFAPSLTAVERFSIGIVVNRARLREQGVLAFVTNALKNTMRKTLSVLGLR